MKAFKYSKKIPKKTKSDGFDGLLSKLKKAKKFVPKKKFPQITIERMGMDADGHITFIDLHDEKFGEAIFFGNGSRHHHGFMNGGVYDPKL